MSEGYQGVKFDVTYNKKVAPKHPEIQILALWCEIFHEKELAPPYPGGSYGNLSFRTNSNSFIITGTSIGLKENLNNDCFVEVLNVDTVNKIILINGTRPPSSETMMHDAIYKARPEVNAIFHGHCCAILNWARLFALPETATEREYGTLELVQSVLEVVSKKNFMIIKNHGFIALGKTMNQAGDLSLEMLRKVL